MGLKLKEVSCLLYSVGLFVSGLFMICFSVVWLYRLLHHFEFAPNITISPLILLIVLGVIHLFLTWLGIKGPQREHDFHILLFLVLIVVFLIIELTTAIWSMVIWDDADAAVETLLVNSFEEFKSNSSNVKAWDSMQKNLHCCGLHGPKSYVGEPPESCCDNNSDETTVSPLPCKEYFTQGCQTPARRYVKKLMLNSAIMGFLVTLYLALGIAIYIIFYKELREVRKKRIERLLEIERRQENVSFRTVTDSPAPPLSVPPPTSKPPDTSAPPNTHITTTSGTTNRNKTHAPAVPVPNPPPPGIIYEREAKENTPPIRLNHDRVPVPAPRNTEENVA